MSLELDDLLHAAQRAGPGDRIELRDAIAEHGAAAIAAIEAWLDGDPSLARFAVRVIGSAGRRGNASEARLVLEASAKRAPYLREDIQAELAKFPLRGVEAGLASAMTVANETRRGWACYDAWNAAITEQVFFSEAAPHAPVYLDTDGEWFIRAARAAEAVCGSDSTSRSELLAGALAGTLRPPRRGGLFRTHAERADIWNRSRGLAAHAERPPFIGLLAFCASIAEEMTSDAEFAAHNYYGRLHARLNGVLNTDYPKAEIERSYRAHVHPLWLLLNQWLEDQDGLNGLPTAYAAASLPYVSVPVGQALLRERDRAVLHRVFEQYVGDHRDLGPEDVAEILRPAVRCPPFSGALARVWANRERRGLLAEIFSRELEQWDGSVKDPDTGRRLQRASLVATLDTFPIRRLELSVQVRHAPGASGSFTPVGESSAAVLREGLRDIRFAEDPFGSPMLNPEPAGAFAVEEVLQRSFTLRGTDADISRRFRLCNLLLLDPNEQRYIEADAAQLGIPALVIVRDALVGETDALLAAVARPGWIKLGPSDVPGLPAGWSAFVDVEFLSASPPVKPTGDLEALLPVPRMAVSLSGGLRLPGVTAQREWLQGVPPEVIIADPLARDVTIVGRDEESDSDWPMGIVRGAGVLAIDGELPSGSYSIVATADSGQSVTARFTLRSPESPRVQRSGSAIGASLDSTGHVERTVREEAVSGGLVSTLVPSPLPDLATGDEPPSVERARWSSSPDPESPPPAVTGALPSSAAPDSALPRCATRPGAHTWDLPESKTSVIEGSCRYCGARRYFVNSWYGRQAALREIAARSSGQRLAKEIAALPPVIPREEDHWDDLLYALCAMQSGSWTAFEALVREATPATHPQEAAMNLLALGHVDFEYADWGSRPTWWSVPHPAALEHPDGTHVLAGWRSPSLLREIADAVGEAGGRPIQTLPDNQPTLVKFAGQPPAVGIQALAFVRRGAGESMLAFGSPAWLLSRLPPLERLEGQLEVVSPSGPLEVFDLARLRWGAARVEDGSAVRFGSSPRVYGVARRQDGTVRLRRTDFRLAKHIAARRLGTPLMAYDPDARELSVPLGARLPALYERVAVLCSGRLPETRGGRHIYPAVPPPVAEGLWRRVGLVGMA